MVVWDQVGSHIPSLQYRLQSDRQAPHAKKRREKEYEGLSYIQFNQSATLPYFFLLFLQ